MYTQNLPLTKYQNLTNSESTVELKYIFIRKVKSNQKLSELPNKMIYLEYPSKAVLQELRI